jgi:hypothetical protein
VAYDWFIVSRLRPFLISLAVAVSGFVYVWVAAVRAVPGVRRRKAAARRRKML